MTPAPARPSSLTTKFLWLLVLFAWIVGAARLGGPPPAHPSLHLPEAIVFTIGAVALVAWRRWGR